MFSVNMPTSLKMCGSGSGSGGQVDVIIFLLDREEKTRDSEKNWKETFPQPSYRAEFRTVSEGTVTQPNKIDVLFQHCLAESPPCHEQKRCYILFHIQNMLYNPVGIH